MTKQYFIYPWCVLIFLTLLTGSALAHKVTVFAWVEGGTVFGETKFSGGKKAQNAEIIVQDTAGNELLRTRTDTNGEFSFPVPQKCAMRIELIAGMGHKAEWTIPLEDVQAVGTTDKAAPAAAVQTTEPSAPAPPQAKTKTAGAFSQTELEAAIAATVEKSVENALNKKITPLIKMVADLENKEPSVSDVAGGIGYIFGLAGVALYFKSRQRDRG